MISRLSLKLRLGLGGALLGASTLLTSAILWSAMGQVAERLDNALASEARMNAFAALSNQVASYLVIATEGVQTNLPAETRRERLAPVETQLRRSFSRMQDGMTRAAEDAERLGLDEQTRYGAQSLGLARMEALLNSTTAAIGRETADPASLRPYLDAFSSGVDPLLSQAVNNELIFRNAILSGIETLRERIRLAAVGIACATVVICFLFYFALIRPQFSRLDRLRDAARQIGDEDFSVALPRDEGDEIGRLYAETNRMAEALAARQSEVRNEWDRLNDTIAERTAALKQANAALGEIDADRRRFFADISHELRTPLTVILMEAQIGAQQSGGETKEAFATIEARAGRLTRRIDDLLRVARSESGQLRLDPAPVPLADLLRDVEAEVAAEIDSAGMTLQVAAAPDATVLADGNWLRQVLVSLLRNAIRHARAGRRASLSARIDGGDAEIAVCDNGPGIPQDAQASLFGRFAQGSGAAASQGFGIGLALAHWVVSEHGGSIAVESPAPGDAALGENPGTKIAVRIPLSDR